MTGVRRPPFPGEVWPAHKPGAARRLSPQAPRQLPPHANSRPSDASLQHSRRPTLVAGQRYFVTLDKNDTSAAICVGLSVLPNVFGITPEV